MKPHKKVIRENIHFIINQNGKKNLTSFHCLALGLLDAIGNILQKHFNNLNHINHVKQKRI